jgi:feruloyl esterase
MPRSGWNERYYQVGTGGFAGAIPYTALAAELRQGNAVAATDTGHQGSPFDASWALGAPERIVDYGHRSIEATAKAAGALIAQYYGRAARYRYFAGCSNGGRQALVAAQRFPRLWNGILAGAPAYNWTRQLATFGWIQQRLRSRPAGWIGPQKLAVIQRAALASCTAQAGVRDQIAADPRFCPFDPQVLLCKAQETDTCLTQEQVDSLQAIQRGPDESSISAPTYFGFEPTSAAVAENWDRWIVNSDPKADSQLKFAEQFFRYLVFEDAHWSVSQWAGGRELQLADERSYQGRSLAQMLDANDANLRPLKQQGGKLLMYFGWADAVLAPRAGIDYYQKVIRALGGLAETESFFRLFMVPGMTHCQGGPAPDAFGQSPVSPPLADDAQHSIRRALEAWVETGRAPQTLLAAKYIGGDPARGVEATQLLCPFPRRVALRTGVHPKQAAGSECADVHDPLRLHP